MEHMKYRDLPSWLHVWADHAIGWALHMHRTLGLERLERVYEYACEHALKLAGLRVPVLRSGVSWRIRTPSLFHSDSYSAPPTHAAHSPHSVSSQ